MSEEKKLNKIYENKKSNKTNNNNNLDDILNNEFFKFFEGKEKISDKKAKIKYLTTIFKNNNGIIESLKEPKKLTSLYEIILTNLIENNNNYLLSQIELIKILSENILKSEKTDRKNEFTNFFKKALPKLFDKFYLQNQKINENLIEIFDDSLTNNILELKDFYPLIENISSEEEDAEYKPQIFNFLYEQINKNDLITKEYIPTNIIEIIKKNAEDNESNTNLNNISNQIINILENRSKIDNKNNDNLNEEENKEGFSSFIKKISNLEEEKCEENLDNSIDIKEKNKKNNKDENEKKNMSKSTNIQKGYKTRISRSRKLGALIKSTNNKPETKNEKIQQKESPQTENIKSSSKKSTNEEKDINPSTKEENEIQNNTTQLKEKKVNLKEKIPNDFNIEILVKEPKNNKIQTFKDNDEENKINNNIQDIKMNDVFDDIPISLSHNPLANDILNLENNIEEINDTNNNNIKSNEQIEVKKELTQKEDEANDVKKDNSNDKKKNKKKEKDDSKFNDLKILLGDEICELLSSSKWEEKKHAFELIKEFVEKENDSVKNNNEDLFQFIKLKLKDFKETNFNIIREAINIFVCLCKKNFLSKNNLLILINTYYEKIADLKLKDNFIELINTSIEESIINISSMISNLITKILKKNNTKILTEYSLFFNKIIEDNNNNIKSLPINEMVNYCKYMAGNSNPQVRTSAISLICTLYKYVGEDIKLLIKDIKESTLKIIDSELEKVTVEKKDKSKNTKSKISKSNSDVSKDNTELKTQMSLITPVDISKKITSQLIKDILEGKWAVKKEACENIENILKEANMKILPIGLNDLFNAIKEKLSDGNKNLVKILISLISKFIQCLKKEFKPWTKLIALSLIPNLSDKNQNIQNECQLCFEKWVEFVGIDSLILYFPQFLKNENTEMRIEIMKFIKKYNHKMTKNIAENIYKELIDGLLICLQDRTNSVRVEAEEIIKLSLDHVNIDNYYKKIKDFKPAIENDLKVIMDNIKNDILLNNKEDGDNDDINNNPANDKKNNDIEIPMNDNKNVKNKKKQTLKNNKNSNLENNFTTNYDEKLNKDNDNQNIEEDKEDNKSKNKGLYCSSIKKRKNNLNKTAEKEKLKKSNSKLLEGTDNIEKNTKNPLASNSTVLRSSTKKITGSQEKTQRMNRRNTSMKNQFNDNIFMINAKLPVNKSKRLELDKKFKFTIDNMTKDDINKLKDYSKILFTEAFYNNVFDNDFQKVSQCLKMIKNNIDKKDNINLYLDNLDIILKVIAFKLNNNLNPLLIKNLFSFLDSLYILVNENGYKFHEIEFNIIICLLADKLSLNNIQLKENLINLIYQYMELYDINKSGIIMLNYGLLKNNKIKFNILRIIIELYLDKKINLKNKNYIKITSKYLLVNDNSVKTECLTLFREIYELIKDELWNIKDIGEKEKNFLEKNILRQESDYNLDEVNYSKDNNNNNLSYFDDNEEENNDIEYNKNDNSGEKEMENDIDVEENEEKNEVLNSKYHSDNKILDKDDDYSEKGRKKFDEDEQSIEENYNNDIQNNEDNEIEVNKNEVNENEINEEESPKLKPQKKNSDINHKKY